MRCSFCKMLTNTIRFIIKAEDDGISIKQFLRGNLSFSMHQISRIKYREPGFLVNGTPQFVNYLLHEGDELVFSLDAQPLPDETFSKEDQTGQVCAKSLPTILYEDPYILIADKPAGMVSHPSHGHWSDSALSLLETGRGRLYLTGRLDKDTSGVLLFAKQKETASILAAGRRAGTIRKTYLARIEGKIEPLHGTIAIPIGIGCPKPLKMCPDPENGKEAVTHYETLYTGDEDSILKIRIDHGRTHQIRVHFASIGHPLIGDALYGHSGEEGGVPAGAQLHAWKIGLRHPYTGEEVRAEAMLPEWAAIPSS